VSDDALAVAVKDGYGVTIEAGDLVVSHDVVGTVKAINKWKSINVRYEGERVVYAYEKGAPDVPYEYRPYKWNPISGRYSYGEPETRFRNDMRVVGTKTVELTQVRVSTHNIIVLRKRDGSTPKHITEALAMHELVFSNKESGGSDE